MSAPRLTDETIAFAKAFYERTLTREEFDAYVEAPMSDDERREMLAHLDWFQRRYPTPAERLAHNRRVVERIRRQVEFLKGG